MPLLTEYRALLDQLAEADAPPLTEMPIEAARAMFRVAQPTRPDISVGNVEERAIEGRNGSIPIRVYTPIGTGPFPVTMMFHGGGWVIGDLETVDAQSRQVCTQVGCVVVAVDYRLAPEHRFPAAAEDSYDATVWTHENATQLNADPTRLAVAGDSAGGNLAAVVAQMARDQGGPSLVFQLLVYPVTNGSVFETDSYHDNAEGYMLTSDSMHWFWNHYAEEGDRSNPYASPLCASDLSNLPPALVQVAEFDPLRDEGLQYADALDAAGVDTQSHCYEGFIHGFFSHFDTVPPTRIAMDDACAALQSAFNR
ncbi:MAG: alpha/beta hydrolase [Gammaproteobacteria bacterium]|nr:alpha/beta hydrolase [Gammaproteobacteria bacterium]